MSGIWWLASYPKSGNTWLRALLTSLISGASIDINDMSVLGGGIASARALIDDMLGIESAELSEEQQAVLRPRAYEVMAAEAAAPLYLKVHDAYAATPWGEPLFPLSATAGAVYVVRNPLDVAVSLTHYYGVSSTRAVDLLLQHDACLAGGERCLRAQFAQQMGDWPSHVDSWRATPFPVHVVRYEDLLADTEATLRDVVRFLHLPADAAGIRRATEDCALQNLRAQEQQTGYKANSRSGNKFFRRGVAGAWQDELPADQADRILGALRPAMQRLGY